MIFLPHWEKRPQIRVDGQTFRIDRVLEVDPSYQSNLTVNMAYESGAPRPMMDVTSLNLTCATCGKPITELPFMPQMNPDGTPARPVYCKEHKPQRKDFRPRGRF